jgi:hypothetical protein
MITLLYPLENENREQEDIIPNLVMVPTISLTQQDILSYPLDALDN